MARLIFFADSHLVDNVWKHKPDLKGDAYYALSSIIEYTTLEQPDAILCGGDIFDTSKPTDFEVKQLFNQLVKLSNQNPNLKKAIPFYYIKGNHDNNVGEGWPSIAGPLLNHVANVSNMILEIGNAKILSFDHMPRSQLLDRLASIPDDVNVVMLHVALKEVLGFENSYEVMLKELPAGKVPRVYLLGDIHQPYEYVNTKKKIQVYYPGSTHALDVTQDHEKQFLEVNVDISGNINVTKIGIPSRPLFNFELRDEADLEKFLKSGIKKIKSKIEELQDKVLDEFLKPIVCVKFNPIKDAYSRLLAELIPISFAFLKPIPIKSSTIELNKKKTEPVSLLEVIKLVMDESFDPTVAEITKELLSEKDPAKVLDSWEKRFINATS
jgi:DNA repair exonuclease SbcCD nuclease subunit